MGLKSGVEIVYGLKPMFPTGVIPRESCSGHYHNNRRGVARVGGQTWGLISSQQTCQLFPPSVFWV
jgi:hypothetical protein